MTELPDPSVLDDAGRLVGDSVQRNFDALAGQPQPARVYGPFDTGASSAMAPDAETSVTVTHGLGLGTGYVVSGHLYDGFGAAGCGWRAVCSSNAVTITFRNLLSVSGVVAALRFSIVAG